MEENNTQNIAAETAVTPASEAVQVAPVGSNSGVMKWFVAGLVIVIVLAVAAAIAVIAMDKKDKDSDNGSDDTEQTEDDSEDNSTDEDLTDSEDSSGNEDSADSSREVYEGESFSIEYPSDWFFTETVTDRIVATSIDATLDGQEYLESGKSYAMLLAYTSTGDSEAWAEIDDGNCEIFSDSVVDGFVSGFNGGTSGSAVNELDESDVDVDVDSTSINGNSACRFSFNFPISASTLETEVDVFMDIYMVINSDDENDDLYAVGAASFGAKESDFDIAVEALKTFKIK
jgi:hypothetical protein